MREYTLTEAGRELRHAEVLHDAAYAAYADACCPVPLVVIVDALVGHLAGVSVVDSLPVQVHINAGWDRGPWVGTVKRALEDAGGDVKTWGLAGAEILLVYSLEIEEG